MQNDEPEISDVDEPVRDLPDDGDDSDRPVINVSSNTVKFRMHGSKIEMKPGQVRHIPKAYAIPRQLQPNAPALPSTVEHLTGGQVLPADHEKARSHAAAARAKGLL